jgi:hypothetical protein
MRLAWQWVSLERTLPGDWSEVQLVLKVRERDADRAAALLGGAGPLRHGGDLRLYVSRTNGFGPEALRRALVRLDRRDVQGTLELARVSEAETRAGEPQATLAGAWEAALAELPADWSDLYAELALRSSDHLERAALLGAPLNPARPGKEPALRFRAARLSGYGVSAQMARRCLARLDEEGIPGALTILHVLSDTHHAATQGPVWRVGGRPV